MTASERDADDPSSARASRALLIALAFALFAAASGTHALTPLFPELKAALGLCDVHVRALTAVFTLGYSVAGFVLGVAVDRVGRLRVLLASLVVFGFASSVTWFFCDRPGSYAIFLFLRFVAGVATGGISSAAITLAADSAPFARRGAAMSLVMAGTYAAMILAMPLAAALATIDLGLVFPVLGALALIAFPICLRRAPRDVANTDRARKRDMLKIAVASSAAKGALCVTFLNTFAAFAVVMSFADAAVDRFAATTLDRSLLFLVIGVASLVGVAIAQRFADRHGKRRAVILALLFSLVTLPIVLGPATFAGFSAAASIVAIASAVRQGPYAAILTELVPQNLRGTLVGWNSLCSGFGLATGSWLGGLAYQTDGLKGAVLLSAIAIFASLVVFVRFVRVPELRPVPV